MAGQRTTTVPVRATERTAERWHGVLGPRQLADVRPGVVAHRRSVGRWVKVRRGVSRVAGAPPSWKQTVLAAVLAAGDQAFASHATGARLLGAEAFQRSWVIELLTPEPRRLRMEGVVAHRFRTLEEGDVIRRDGIPCASGVRVAIDLSGRLGPAKLGVLVDELIRSNLLDLETLRLRVERTPAARGRSLRTLRAVLAARIAGYDPGESALEARLLRTIVANGFPRPEQQLPVRTRWGSYRLDFAYPERRIFLEGNGFGWHRLASDLDRTSRRQNGLVLSGWTPIELTWRMSDAEIVGILDALFDRATASWRARPGATAVGDP